MRKTAFQELVLEVKSGILGHRPLEGLDVVLETIILEVDRLGREVERKINKHNLEKPS